MIELVCCWLLQLRFVYEFLFVINCKIMKFCNKLWLLRKLFTGNIRPMNNFWCSQDFWFLFTWFLNVEFTYVNRFGVTSDKLMNCVFSLTLSKAINCNCSTNYQKNMLEIARIVGHVNSRSKPIRFRISLSNLSNDVSDFSKIFLWNMYVLTLK